MRSRGVIPSAVMRLRNRRRMRTRVVLAKATAWPASVADGSEHFQIVEIPWPTRWQRVRATVAEWLRD